MIPTYSVQATNLRRYSVPQEAYCTVRAGVEMIVREGFIIDGLLVLEGVLWVGEGVT